MGGQGIAVASPGDEEEAGEENSPGFIPALLRQHQAIPACIAGMPHLLWHSCTSSAMGSRMAVLLVTASNTASLVLGGSAAAT